MKHELKTWPTYFERVISGEKQFEVRYNDRDFQTGDIVTLREYDNDKNTYTGRQVQATITYVLNGGQFGIEQYYVVFGIGAIIF